MPHAPFIIASYLLALILLGWCAAAPLIRKRRLIRNIRLTADTRSPVKPGDKHASDT